MLLLSIRISSLLQRKNPPLSPICFLLSLTSVTSSIYWNFYETGVANCQRFWQSHTHFQPSGQHESWRNRPRPSSPKEIAVRHVGACSMANKISLLDFRPGSPDRQTYGQKYMPPLRSFPTPGIIFSHPACGELPLTASLRHQSEGSIDLLCGSEHLL